MHGKLDEDGLIILFKITKRLVTHPHHIIIYISPDTYILHVFTSKKKKINKINKIYTYGRIYMFFFFFKSLKLFIAF
jgi:hypothetical protein